VGEAEAWLRELRRDGFPVPELDEEPTLDAGLALAAWTAFATLSDSRPVHFGGAGSIPLSEIEAYCRLTELEDVELRASLVRLIRRMDRAFLAGNQPERKRDG
jgi:hypothetical protein